MLERRIRDVAKKIWFGESRRGRVRVSSRLEEQDRRMNQGKLARRDGQEKRL